MVIIRLADQRDHAIIMMIELIVSESLFANTDFEMFVRRLYPDFRKGFANLNEARASRFGRGELWWREGYFRTTFGNR
jgi:hypothetical protein